MSSPKIYQVSNLQTSLNNRVLKAGDTVTGELKLLGSGVSLNVANTGYFSGNVGIGTTNPSGKLDISGAGDVYLSNTAAAPTNGLSIPGSIFFSGYGWNTLAGSLPISGRILLDGSYSPSTGSVEPFISLSLRGSGGSGSAGANTLTERVRITNSGNVGIGTTNPARELHIIGNIKLSETGSIWIGNDADSGNRLRMHQNGNNGYIDWSDGSLFFRNGTSGVTSRMSVDGSGRLIIASWNGQPRFLAYRSGDQTGYNSTSQGDVPVIFNATDQNIGSHYNTSTGKFTAPVAGMYAFQASVYSVGGTAFDQCWLVVNGSRGSYTDCVYTNSPTSFICGTWIIYLNANDSVGFHAYNPTNTNQTITASQYHTWFKGYMLG